MQGVRGSAMGGCLVLSGRAKDTIVLSSGKNIEPQPIEDALCVSPLIKFATVVSTPADPRASYSTKVNLLMSTDALSVCHFNMSLEALCITPSPNSLSWWAAFYSKCHEPRMADRTSCRTPAL